MRFASSQSASTLPGEVLVVMRETSYHVPPDELEAVAGAPQRGAGSSRRPAGTSSADTARLLQLGPHVAPVRGRRRPRSESRRGRTSRGNSAYTERRIPAPRSKPRGLMWVTRTRGWGPARGASRPARSTSRQSSLNAKRSDHAAWCMPSPTHTPNPHQASRNPSVCSDFLRDVDRPVVLEPTLDRGKLGVAADDFCLH